MVSRLAYLLLLAGVANAQTSIRLNLFEEFDSSNIPRQCRRAYNQALEGCRARDFIPGAQCSDDCLEGIEELEEGIQEACGGVMVPVNTLLGQAILGNLQQLLCPNNSEDDPDTTTTTSTTRTTIVRPTSTPSPSSLSSTTEDAVTTTTSTRRITTTTVSETSETSETSATQSSVVVSPPVPSPSTSQTPRPPTETNTPPPPTPGDNEDAEEGEGEGQEQGSNPNDLFQGVSAASSARIPLTSFVLCLIGTLLALPL